MSKTSTNIKCFNCGSALHFDGVSQELVCDHCGSHYSPEEVETRLERQPNPTSISGSFANKTDELEKWSNQEESQLTSFSCPSCGAQLLADSTLVASNCPYCGNNMVIESQLQGGLRPDQIIPFHLVKKDAKEMLKQFYKGKPLLPNHFKEENHIDEIKGIYVPFWLYDGSVRGESERMATITHSSFIGDDTYIRTDHYLVRRGGQVNFKRVPADASSKMPDELMDAIEPFDYQDLVPFQMSYLAGYYADRYDIDSQQDSERVDERIRNTSAQLINDEFRFYPMSYPISESYEILPGDVHYVFLPVWLLTTKYNGETYRFALNGQTGKMVSDDLPVDKGKMFMHFILMALGIFVVLVLFLFILWRY